MAHNGVGLTVKPSRSPWPFGEGDDDVAIQQQIAALADKVDDVRSSVVAIAVTQEKVAGDLRVVSTKLDGFEDRFEPRLEALEVARQRDQWQAWGERLAAALVGAGGLGLAQHFFSATPK